MTLSSLFAQRIGALRIVVSDQGERSSAEVSSEVQASGAYHQELVTTVPRRDVDCAQRVAHEAESTMTGSAAGPSPARFGEVAAIAVLRPNVESGEVTQLVLELWRDALASPAALAPAPALR